MSIQCELNQEVFDKLPRILERMKTLEPHQRDNLINLTLRSASSCRPALEDMNEFELAKLELSVLSKLDFLL